MFYGWVIVSAVGCIGIAGSLLVFPMVEWVDPMQLARSLVLRTGTCFMGILVLLGSLVLADILTPSDWLRKIGEDPMACAVVCAALSLALALVFVYS